MAETTGKFKKIFELVELGEYFTIHRPRQYGKTTMLETIGRYLRPLKEWLVFKISFEGIGSEVFLDEGAFCNVFLELLEQQMIEYEEKDLAAFLKQAAAEVKTLKALSKSITELANLADRKMVLLIDEVDKSSNNQLFLDFLAILRNKYLNRHLRTERTFHSVVLAGLHDVKSLKFKIRSSSNSDGGGEAGAYNSPWNIAADFEVDMNLYPHEIAPMLDDYAQERGVDMDVPAVAEKLFYYTSGYPFLVSMLCKITDEKILPQKSERSWTVEDIETAAETLIKSERSNTNFDSLIKNLENNPGLYELVYRLIIDNSPFPYNVHDPIIHLGILHGIFRNGQGLNIHNRIYREIIGNYMASKLVTTGKLRETEYSESYTLPGNALNLERVLLKFQAFMREQYSKKDREFLERNGRLIFLAFLQPILNGRGYAFKEPELSEERRLDIAITYSTHKYAVELKIWRGAAAHEKGLSQLTDYLDRQQLDTGYLVIYDHAETKTWENGWLDVGGKRVFAVWV